MRETKVLSQEITSLLNKLYNLRGEESVRLLDINNQQKRAEETRDRTVKEEAELKEKIAFLEKKLKDLNTEGAALAELLSGIDRAKYETVLDVLRIDFDPFTLKAELDKSLPKEVSRTTEDIKSSKTQLKSVQKEMTSAEDEISEISIRVEDERNIQAKLNEYFEIALNGNINVTRDEITNLLRLFDFTDEEQREIAKILMFPEDALLVYETQRREREKSGRNIAEVIEEASAQAEANPEPEEIEVAEDALETTPAMIVEDLENKDAEVVKQDVLEFLSDFIDVKSFSKKDVETIRVNFDKDLIKANIEFTRSKNISDNIYYQVPTLIIDDNLQSKIEFMINDLAKTGEDISFAAKILSTYSSSDLVDIKNKILSLEIDPRQVPLYIYKLGMDKFIENINYFFNKGIRFDAKSIAKQPFALAISSIDNTKKVCDILDNYGLSITKPNGKNVIPLLSRKANRLAKDLDLMIEIGQLDYYKNNLQEMCGDVA